MTTTLTARDRRAVAERLSIEATLEDVGVAPSRRKGRGTQSNPSGRFEPTRRVAFDDGWETAEELPPLETTITIERAKKLIMRNSSPDISFDRSINPYRGCEHGCAYCFARPTHAFVGLSPGLDFETKLFAKTNAAQALMADLAAPGYEPKTIALGTSTDPYQPIERKYRLTRQILEVLDATSHPVGIVTKSHLVTRDIDILSRMAKRHLVKVAVSVTSLDAGLARRLEPRAPTPLKRLETIRQLAEAGVPVGVLVAPVIPALNDQEIEPILEAAHAAGAGEAGYVMLRLPHELADLFKQWLLENAPDRMRRVLSLVRSVREGKDYDSTWGRRMTGTGPYAWTIGRRFELAVDRLGFRRERLRLRSDLFVPPARGEQLKLL
jgi:DNA repair photolyase